MSRQTFLGGDDRANNAVLLVRKAMREIIEGGDECDWGVIENSLVDARGLAREARCRMLPVLMTACASVTRYCNRAASDGVCERADARQRAKVLKLCLEAIKWEGRL